MRRRTIIVSIIATMILMLAFVFSLTTGTYDLSIKEIIHTFMGQGNKTQSTIVFQLRLPRICIAVFVGAALSTAGCILQSITRNSLAEPGIIGMNAGAALAVVLLIATGSSNYYETMGSFTLILMPVVSIIGSFLATLIIYSLSYRKGINPTRLILVGIGVSAAINSIITLFQLNMSKGNYNQALTWISGSLWGSSWTFFYLIAPVAIVFIGIAIYKSELLDVINLGDELATGLGIHVEKERRLLLMVALVLSAIATAVAGNIAFLGLLGPHIAKGIVGPKHRRKIPVAALISGIIIVIADTASRSFFAPLEIPVGMTISVIGVPYFIYLMMKEK